MKTKVPHDLNFETFLTTDKNVCNYSPDMNKYLSLPISSEGGSAIVDISSDCKNDLIITSIDETTGKQILEIYMGVYDSNN